MIHLIKDTFVTNLIHFNSYIVNKMISVKDLEKIKRPFFITIKSKKKLFLNTNTIKDKISLISKLIYFEKSFKRKQLLYVKCRNAKKNDIKQIIKIAKERHLNSRFMADKLIPIKFKEAYRSEWVKNFFKKKRGDFLIVAERNKKILGFILILKKKNQLIIDLIVSSKKYRKKRVATSLVNYINNKIMKKNDRITAGTQMDNLVAIKMYKKLGFLRKKKETFCYHIHGR